MKYTIYKFKDKTIKFPEILSQKCIDSRKSASKKE